MQGLRRAVEREKVHIHFIEVKGHMDQYKGFLPTFRCEQGNKLADDYATKGMHVETTAMPYIIETVSQHMWEGSMLRTHTHTHPMHTHTMHKHTSAHTCTHTRPEAKQESHK